MHHVTDQPTPQPTPTPWSAHSPFPHATACNTCQHTSVHATRAEADQARAEHVCTARAASAVSYRITRSTEVAPGWWGKRREVGDTRSAAVASDFCDQQNAVTMNPNRPQRIQYSVEPILPAVTA